MNKSKSWLSVLLLVGLFSFSAMASSVDLKEPKTVNQQFSELLKGLLASDLADEKTVYVDFMINEKAEIIVLATNNKKLDETIKHKLNYKKLTTSDLAFYKRYTLPISFKK